MVVYSIAPASSSVPRMDAMVEPADLLVRVAGEPVLLLVDDGVDSDGRLAGLPVTDDQLALAAADGGHRVDGLDTGLQRLVDRLALHDGGGLQLQRAALGRGDRALAVDRVAQGVHDAAQEVVADRRREDLAGAAHRLALLDLAEVATTAPISRTSRFSARPRVPSSNSRSSLAIAEGRPETRAIPSPDSVTVPTSSRAAASGS
jgi:hypothetical protein